MTPAACPGRGWGSSCTRLCQPWGLGPLRFAGFGHVSSRAGLQKCLLRFFRSWPMHAPTEFAFPSGANILHIMRGMDSPRLTEKLHCCLSFARVCDQAVEPPFSAVLLYPQVTLLTPHTGPICTFTGIDPGVAAPTLS